MTRIALLLTAALALATPALAAEGDGSGGWQNGGSKDGGSGGGPGGTHSHPFDPGAKAGTPTLSSKARADASAWLANHGMSVPGF